MFCYTSKLKKIICLQKNYFLEVGWHTNLQQFQGAQPDYLQVESSSCCFPRLLLVSFVCPRKLVSIDPWHMTVMHPPPIRKKYLSWEA